MGVVYRARHALLRRPTAIKLLPAGRSGPQGLERFEREVQRTAELTHPNTIHIYDYGRSLDGIFYYVMEYLEGIDLERLVRAYGPQPPDRAIAILRQVCASLGEAHARGLVHRDVKPANVMLCRRGSLLDFVKVLDFGLVQDHAPGTQPAATPLLAGTPAYLAPEATLDPHATGSSADVYALGCVAYFLVTGTEVFTGRSALEICTHHQHTPPEPPSRRAPHPLPQHFEELVLACLRKDPAERPPSVEQIAEALAAIPDGGSWSEDAARRWWADFTHARPPAPFTHEADTSGDTLPVDVEHRSPAGGSAVLVPRERGHSTATPSTPDGRRPR